MIYRVNENTVVEIDMTLAPCSRDINEDTEPCTEVYGSCLACVYFNTVYLEA